MCISKPQNAHTTRYKVLKWGGKKGIRKKDTTADLRRCRQQHESIKIEKARRRQCGRKNMKYSLHSLTKESRSGRKMILDMLFKTYVDCTF